LPTGMPSPTAALGSSSFDAATLVEFLQLPSSGPPSVFRYCKTNSSFFPQRGSVFLDFCGSGST
jgi:hypothetical protein